jgi:hypothetical protein
VYVHELIKHDVLGTVTEEENLSLQVLLQVSYDILRLSLVGHGLKFNTG